MSLKTYNEAGFRCLLIPKEEWLAAKTVLDNLKLTGRPLSGIIAGGKIAELTIDDDAVTITTINDSVKKTVKCGWDGGTEVKENG